MSEQNRRRMHPNSLKNLRPPWRPGESGQPGGVSGKPISDAYRKLMPMEVPEDMLVGPYEKFKGTGITFAEIMAFANMVRGLTSGKGATSAMAEITNRVEGRVPYQIQGTMEHVAMTLEEREARLRELNERVTLRLQEGKNTNDIE